MQGRASGQIGWPGAGVEGSEGGGQEARKNFLVV